LNLGLPVYKGAEPIIERRKIRKKSTEVKRTLKERNRSIEIKKR
jgi:hypothetical protein